jgi:hypothetical protein
VAVSILKVHLFIFVGGRSYRTDSYSNSSIKSSFKLKKWFLLFNSYSNILDFVPLVRFEVFTAVTMKNGVFCDDTPCGPSKNRRTSRFCFIGVMVYHLFWFQLRLASCVSVCAVFQFRLLADWDVASRYVCHTWFLES